MLVSRDGDLTSMTRDALSEGRQSLRGVPGAVVEAPVSIEAPAPPARAGAKSGRQRYWRDTKRRRMLAVADLLAAVLASLVAASSLALAPWALLLLPLWLVIAQLLGLYDRDQRAIRHLTVDELAPIAAWAAIGAGAIGLFGPLTPIGEIEFARIAAIWLVATVGAVVLRSGARALWRSTTPRELTAVIGDGELAWAAKRKLELFRDMHLELHRDVEVGSPSDERVDADELRELARRVDRVIVASESLHPTWIGTLNGICREEQVKLSVVSPLRGRAGAAPRLSEVADLPVLEYDTGDVSRTTMFLKRVFDITFSAAALALLLPLLPLVAVAIRLDSPGPTIFRQRRAGIQGRPFLIFKLRTMHAAAEEELEKVVSIEDLPEPSFKLRQDPRVTRVGRLLRRCSIDELPQLVNVLRGDMSIVGPRPEMMPLVARYRPEHYFRLAVKPGMTGPMQVYGRGALDFQERLAVELDYVENLSLIRDLRILAQTVPALIRGTGAY
jgi:exopolysaccharide biosynthesis polyprenyl glycosylphosphotransferase